MSSPKASLHSLYLNSEQQPRYETISVPAEKESPKNGSVVSAAFLVKPLSLQQGGFRCTLYVPSYPPVISEVFSRKKEAEQDAARKALEQVTIYPCWIMPAISPSMFSLFLLLDI